MYLKQSELFNGMSMEFIRKAMDTADREHYQQGNILFRTGEYASRFYIIISGSIQLILEDNSEVVYTASEPGELVGWSALVDRQSYTAAGRCQKSTDVFKIDRKKFHHLLQREPDAACLFYKNLCNTLGNRLEQVYQFITKSSS